MVAEPFVPPLHEMFVMLDERVYVLPLTARVAAILVPHALLAATEIFPEELPFHFDDALKDDWLPL